MDNIPNVQARARVDLDDSCNCSCCMFPWKRRTPAVTREDSKELEKKVQLIVSKSLEELRRSPNVKKEG